MDARKPSVVLLLALIACNGVTGLSELYVEGVSPDGAVDVGGGTSGSNPTPSPTTTSTSEPNPPGTDGGTPTSDAKADTSTPRVDATPDVITPIPTCTPGNTGIRYGSQAEGNTWTQKSGALLPGDDNWAHTNDNAPPLVLTGFTFPSIPGNARIDGILVDIYRTAEGAISDNGITIVKGSAKNNGKWPERNQQEPFVKSSYGGTTDLWGTSWTASDFAAFRVTLAVQGGGDGHVDGVGVTVFYCVPP